MLNVPRTIQLLKTYPSITPLLYVFKYALQQSSLDLFCEGGVSSNLLVQMLYSIIQQTKEEERNHLGILFCKFCQVFALEFNSVLTGITTLKGGRYFNRFDYKLMTPNSPYVLCVQDPQNPSLVLGMHTTAYAQFKIFLTSSYNRITNQKRKDQTLLSCILNEPKYIMKLRDKMKFRYERLCEGVPIVLHQSFDITIYDLSPVFIPKMRVPKRFYNQQQIIVRSKSNPPQRQPMRRPKPRK